MNEKTYPCKEVWWGVREGLCGEVLLARSLLSAAERELTPLLGEAPRGWRPRESGGERRRACGAQRRG
jgi:hypothetical protein